MYSTVSHCRRSECVRNRCRTLTGSARETVRIQTGSEGSGEFSSTCLASRETVQPVKFRTPSWKPGLCHTSHHQAHLISLTAPWWRFCYILSFIHSFIVLSGVHCPVSAEKHLSKNFTVFTGYSNTPETWVFSLYSYLIIRVLVVVWGFLRRDEAEEEDLSVCTVL